MECINWELWLYPILVAVSAISWCLFWLCSKDDKQSISPEGVVPGRVMAVERYGQHVVMGEEVVVDGQVMVGIMKILTIHLGN